MPGAPLHLVANGSYSDQSDVNQYYQQFNGNFMYDVDGCFGAKFDNSTDDTTSIQNAIDTASVASAGSALTPSGARVILPVGIAVISHLTIKTHVDIEGQGMWSTILKAPNSNNQDMISVFQSPDNIIASAEFWTIRQLQIWGNKANQTSGHGITLTLPPSPQATYDNENDSRWLLERLLLRDIKQNGFNQIGTRNEGYLVHCYALRCDGYGFHEAGSDVTYTGCNAGASGLAGFHIVGTSLRFHGCKSWFSGYVDQTKGHGYHLDGAYPGSINFACCEAQDNSGAGWRLENGGHRVNIQGTCDSNSHYTTGAYAAVELSDYQWCIIDVVCLERIYDGTNSRQRNAIKLSGTSINNQIRLTHGVHNSSLVNDPVMSSSTSVAGNNLQINGMGAYEVVTYAATITPSPYTATTKEITVTGNIVINNTVDTGTNANTFLGHKGCRMRFKFISTGAGGWTVGFGTQYKLSAAMPNLTTGKTSIIEFEFDGTNWVQANAQLNNI